MPIPPRLAEAVAEDDLPSRWQWLSALPGRIEEIAADWGLRLGEPYLPGGQCAWVAPVRAADGEDLVLKVAWRHREAEHEAAGLRHWDGDGAIRCHAARDLDDATTALLLERCRPGRPLAAVPPTQQDEIIAELLQRLWARPRRTGHPFDTLESLCNEWADTVETAYASNTHRLDPGLARAGLDILRTLPASTSTHVLLCTDLHAENVLSAEREPWLVIDPKPFIGDPAFDVVQHMLNCDDRLHTDPVGLLARMAGLLDLEPQRVRLWLFARCVQESAGSLTAGELARRVAP
ncbi:aminoglycoside phosphotransferase family protein [Jatrophihabitans cynanchi]|uniref:Aminoglycoside phosphotransferase family protein n=1 Tax=Jatrophihabitans cynanchi TaxID=2944128 RepID=A0ABY7K2V5_9ACTN|nr:aminoglycoside phosphotransferase family protein [Jatrophihabitans sp. SB3-54]WAX59169.1 aminoglycoside phosphotransferase family protein [Jatrophihabitans sp. SB3-54]